MFVSSCGHMCSWVRVLSMERLRVFECSWFREVVHSWLRMLSCLGVFVFSWVRVFVFPVFVCSRMSSFFVLFVCSSVRVFGCSVVCSNIRVFLC